MTLDKVDRQRLNLIQEGAAGGSGPVSPAEIAVLWPDYAPTRLINSPALAHLASVKTVLLKLECDRPLGNFKALGGMVAAFRALARLAGGQSLAELLLPAPAARPCLLCASDGNHGLAVAAAAGRAGAPARVYLPQNVSAVRAGRIRSLGGEVAWVSGTYDDAVYEARAASQRGEGILIPDTSDDAGDPVVRDVMAGYGLISAEIKDQIQDDHPTHLFVQAGVGGLAAALAAGLRDWMSPPRGIAVVEPAGAACVAAALAAGHPVPIDGSLATAAAMLSCGLASAPALQVLLENRARSVVVSENQLADAVPLLGSSAGVHSTPSGAAGLAGFVSSAADPLLRSRHGISGHSTVLLVITEG